MIASFEYCAERKRPTSSQLKSGHPGARSGKPHYSNGRVIGIVCQFRNMVRPSYYMGAICTRMGAPVPCVRWRI